MKLLSLSRSAFTCTCKYKYSIKGTDVTKTTLETLPRRRYSVTSRGSWVSFAFTDLFKSSVRKNGTTNGRERGRSGLTIRQSGKRQKKKMKKESERKRNGFAVWYVTLSHLRAPNCRGTGEQFRERVKWMGSTRKGKRYKVMQSNQKKKKNNYISGNCVFSNVYRSR